ncbi:hypothetical protein [Corynebacterium accolens]|uniref:hypothetical protein n=1 Tax=Corynebacterium accolens TaxID=38284 RepID=UPI0025431152|nr:hypothetical protein [Corynebacterium accolens]MDK4309932.1 hypothetical protein [Corynebacterium accolens]WKS68026.1 hypothetical protein NLL40_06220 [Corynebacterium accolens]WKS72246.1 hypothetical protein NLL38_04885 [Corynebacterium accolens]WKS72566.1 hypothetical protein NLL44_06235 [Corynebacterium accolens]
MSKAQPSESSEPTGSPKVRGKRIVTAVIAILAVIALVAASTWAYTGTAEPKDQAHEPAFGDIQSTKPSSDAADKTAEASKEEGAGKGDGKGSGSGDDSDEEAKPGEKKKDATAQNADAKPQGKKDSQAKAGSQKPSTGEKCGSYAEAHMGGFYRPVQIYCDANWLFAGDEGTSFHTLYQWSGNTWVAIEKDGRSYPSNYPCFSEEKLSKAGVPKEIVEDLLTC